MPDFPALDATYAAANAELGRVVLDELGEIQPHIDETDGWCTIPIRAVFNQAAGVHIELGPYSLSEIDLRRLRGAIRKFDIATNGTTLRRIK